MPRAVRDSRELRAGLESSGSSSSAARRRREAARAAAAAEEELDGASSSHLDRSRSERERKAAQDRLEGWEEAVGHRPFWPRPRHFLFTSLSCVVGVGGVVFWPQFLADYGAAFAVASGVLLLAVHLPLLLLEVGLGQFSSSGPLHVFRHVLPALEAVGWAQLLLGLYYGLVNGFYAAWHLYSLAAVVAGNGGSRCVDPQREPSTHNTPCCTSGPAFEACRALAPGREESRWLVAGRCHVADSLSDLYLQSLQECWANASAGRPVDGPLCSVSLHLHFNGTSPLGFFRLEDQHSDLTAALRYPHSERTERARREGLDTSCFHSLFKEKKRCLAGLQPLDASFEWDETVEVGIDSSLEGQGEREMIIDLRHWEELPEQTTARAACLHRLLNLTQLERRTCQPARPFAPDPPAAATALPLPRRRRKRGWARRRAGGGEWKGRRVRAAGQGGLEGVPAMTCLLRSYCEATFPMETGLGDMACFRRVLNPVPSLATFERDRVVHGYRGPDADWSEYLWVWVVLSWPLVHALVWGGVRRIGKLSFLLGPLPLILIMSQTSVFIFRPELLPGFLWALRLDWCRLLEPGLWVRASATNFFSLGLGKGVLMTLASYNRFHQDCLRDVLLASLASFCAGVTGGAVMVGYVAALGDKLSLGPARVLDTGLAFNELFLQALEEHHFLFIIVGIMNLIFFILTTMCSVVLALGTAASDEVVWLRLKWGRLVAGASALTILPSLLLYGRTDSSRQVYGHVLLVESLVTPAAQLVFVVLLAYVYGARRLLGDLAMMADGGAEYREGSVWGTGRALVLGRGRKWLLGSWVLVSPLALAVLTGLAVAEEWEPGLALLGGLVLLFVPALLFSLLKRKISPANLFRARLDWAPALDEYRTGRYQFSTLKSEALLGRAHKDVSFRPGSATDLRLAAAIRIQSTSNTHYSNSNLSHSPPPLPSPPLEPDGGRTIRAPGARARRVPLERPLEPDDIRTVRVPRAPRVPPKDPKPLPAKAVSSPSRLPPPSPARKPIPRRVHKPRGIPVGDLSRDPAQHSPTRDESGGSQDGSYDTTTKDHSGPSTTADRSRPSTSPATTDSASPGHSFDTTTSGGSGPRVPPAPLPRPFKPAS